MKKKSKNTPKKQSKSWKYRITHSRIVWSLLAVALLLGVYVFGIYSPIHEDVFYRINQGNTIASVVVDMENSGLVSSDRLLKISIIAQGNRIQTGEYEIKRGTSIWRIARKFNRGDIASTIVMIPEGLTIKQIKKLLGDNELLSGDVECAPTPAAEIPAVCNLQEGDLFPDTYRVPRGATRLSVLELSRKKMESISDAWRKSGKKIPAPLKSWEEVVTLASIVQKETPRASEMPMVASVYLNRLKKKMKLQADPTVVYAITDGLGDMQGRGLFTGHLKTISPYNTYANYGLPPAPIANVGRNAIAAVLDPADTNYLFFVADGTGGHIFAKNYEEHKKNHAAWRQIKKMHDDNK